MPIDGGQPFNKQFDSIMFENLILNMEPPAEGDTTRKPNWNYLHAFDKTTGDRLWVTEDALTYYSAPVLGETAAGVPAVLIARGGPHKVPERPVGLSLINLSADKAGEALWRWTPPEQSNKIAGWGALSTHHWDKDKASWFYHSTDHLTIDTNTGKLKSQHALKPAIQQVYDASKQAYEIKEDADISKWEGQRHCNISCGDYVFYMIRYQPFLVRHNVVTGKTEHLQVPRELDDDGKFIWDEKQKNDGLNSRGQRQTEDRRTLGGGFQKCFLGSPTRVNNYVFFTNAVGIVYVIDMNAETFDKSALVAVNDLGKRGETWTVNSMSFAKGRIFHRTMKELICIGK